MPEVEALAPSQPAAPPAAPPSAPAEGESTSAQNIAEQAPAAPEGEDKDKPKAPPTGQDPEKQSSRRFERRLDKAYRRAAEAQARADLLEKQIAELKPKEPADQGAPRLEDFKDIEEYAAAREKHAADKALKDDQTKRQTEAQKQAQARLVETWEEKAERAEEKYEDWASVVGRLQPTTPWAMALMHAENGEDVAYHLGKNLKEAARIQELQPIQQILEVGRLAAKLAAEPPKPKTPSKAPAPITPLSGAASAATDAPSEQDDMRTWIRKRNKQLGRK